jgi:hypothetical protein
MSLDIYRTAGIISLKIVLFMGSVFCLLLAGFLFGLLFDPKDEAVLFLEMPVDFYYTT